MSDSPLYNYPPAHTVDVVDDYHGTLVPDPYRWLEDTESDETISWTKAQNEFAQDFLQELPGRATSTHPQILRINLKAGHGLGKPTSKLIEEESDIYAFLWTMLAKDKSL